ncbi:MAG: FG-GAP-like repeat-containing protein [Planctomycetota bacterium]
MHTYGYPFVYSDRRDDHRFGILMFLLFLPALSVTLPAAAQVVELGPDALVPAKHGTDSQAAEFVARQPGLTAALSALEAIEYEFSIAGNDCVSAPNRAQGMRVRIDGCSLQVESRAHGVDVAAGGFELTLGLRAIGDGQAMAAVRPGRVVQSGNRAEIHRDCGTSGTVVEWFVNTTAGVEHGFDIPAPLSGAIADRLILELNFASTLRSDLRDGELRLTGASVVTTAWLRYAELHVYDARGRELAAEMRIGSGTLSIVIDTIGAVYPLTVDPVLSTGAAWTAESDQVTSWFGWSVAGAGDVNGDGYSDLIVGARLFDDGQTDEGRAFVYLGSATGLSLTPAWTAASDQAGADFGYSVASAGDVNGDGYGDVIVGARYFSNGEGTEGRAFVYLGSATGLATSAAWTAESDQPASYFGYSVSSAGDVNGDGYDDVIIGANDFDNGDDGEGRAFLYLGTAAGLSLTPAWTAESNQSNSYFGTSVACAGDVNSDGYSDVIVGAPYFDNDQGDEGRAFVYLGSAGGLSSIPGWTSESNQSGALFGSSLASGGDVNGDGHSDVIVGAYAFDGGQTNEGRAFVYLGSTTGPAASPAWTAESNQLEAYFGFSVSIAGDVNGDGYSDVIGGAHTFNGEGRAFVYLGSTAGPSLTPAWTAESGQSSAAFGVCVASAGDVNGDGYSDVIVGAYRFDNGQSDEGRAFVYLGSAAELPLTPAWTAESDQASAQFGVSVASAGDVNGDGYTDVIVGAPYFDNGLTDEGRAFAYFGSATGLLLTPAWTAESDHTGAQFGASVASAGDVNGDGYGDVIVGAWLFDNGQGSAFVYLGAAAGLETSSAWTATSDQLDAYFGSSVASAGDVNGDGYSDVIVGAHSFDNAEPDEGGAFAYFGSAVGLSLTPDWSTESDQAGAHFGNSVSSAGDVNGDGYSDVIVGASLFDNDQTDEGRTFVYLGSAAGLALTPAWTAESDQASSLFGESVATTGDVDGDGYSDVIVGASLFDNGQTDEGRAFVYLGSAAGLSFTPAWTAESDQASAFFGESVATAGDVDGDGYSDVIVGAIGFDNSETDEGRAFVYFGSAAGLSLSSTWAAESNQANANFGESVAGAGDVNGDGYSDVIVGANTFDNGQADEGRAYLYLGNSAGVPRILQQRRIDDTATIAPLGRSDASDEFLLKVRATHPAGRGRVQVECEAKPPGVLFDGTATLLSAPVDTGASTGGASAVAINLAVTALASGTPYHWRTRIHYLDSPNFVHGPWFSPAGNGANETDLRTDCPMPFASFLASQVSGNAPLSVSFTNQSSVSGTATYAWDFNDDALVDSTDQDPVFVYETPGAFTASLTTSDVCGTDGAVMMISVYAPAVAGFMANPPTGDAPLLVNFTSTSSGDIASHAWDFDGDLMTDSSEPSPSHTYLVPGAYLVTLTVTGIGGGTDVATETITVAMPQPQFRRGDANQDATVNIADAISILGYLFSGGLSPACFDVADANDDGTVNIADGITLLAYLFSGSGPTPAPGPITCGPDPTSDALPCETSQPSCP